ncbi:hypothetical protein, partial [Mediterraneibacter gnavus]
AIIIPENGAKVSKIKCFQFAQQTLIIIPFLALKFASNNSIGVLFDVFGVNSGLNFQFLCFLIL